MIAPQQTVGGDYTETTISHREAKIECVITAMQKETVRLAVTVLKLPSAAAKWRTN